MALPSGSFLKLQTPLQQLLEEINFQRQKEMRQLLKDDSGFVVLQGTTYWTDLFVRHFLFQSEPVHNIDSDDLLFFVRKKHVKGSSRHMPKYETEVDVYRKDSRKLPIGDPDVDWEETVYLNMVIHQFDYTLTLAICTRTSPKELQVLRRHSQRVYASPSRRKMDTKGEGEEMTYPHICFMVDNFDEVFSDILVRDGEMVCVELVASDKDGSVQGVIFLGSIRYDALKKVYDARQSSLSSKVAQRMTFGLFSSGAGVQTRCEFVRMKGPQGKGHAEMAVTKPKGSGVETPTSEPGFCATDMWDEWDDEDDYTYRHQRRLSDPSANLNNFTRYGWRTKNSDGTAGNKARSENEGLDSLANEVSEIEAGDLRDDRPASSASETKLNATTVPPVTTKTTTTIKNSSSTCCNCFRRRRSISVCCNKRWSCNSNGSSSSSSSAQMSDIYCRTCDNDDDNDANIQADSPSCLNKMPNRRTRPKHKNVLNVESELILTNNKNKLQSSLKRDKKQINSSPKKERKSLNGEIKINKNHKNNDCKKRYSLNGTNNNEKNQEYELADDAISLNGDIMPTDDSIKIGILSEKDSKLMISVHGEEELPEVVEQTIQQQQQQQQQQKQQITKRKYNINDKIFNFKKCVPKETKNHPLEPSVVVINDKSSSISSIIEATEVTVISEKHLNNDHDDNGGNENDEEEDDEEEENEEKAIRIKLLSDYNGNDGNSNNGGGSGSCHGSIRDDGGGGGGGGRLDEKENEEPFKFTNDCEFNNDFKTSTLPKSKKTSIYQNFYNKALRMVPKMTTPDGTNIYYWCDLPKKALKELDDGAYNPLWATRGFTQTFHFWKENRRQQSTPLNAFLTYVTLPWWSIAKDLLDHRETPILTF